ncbi:hypothetical protein C8R45DRAFT_927743 [Mycena sanguinolenta]|nr:hypothetical protein C8R45DRAFT_927743 [Mycena sanguinolenta]
MVRIPSQDSVAKLKKPLRTPFHMSQDDFNQHRTISGIDFPTFKLFANGAICVCWGAALIVFATGVVPIYWDMSQYGQAHPAITNVIITGVATTSTLHLKYTVKNSARQHARVALQQAINLPRWRWIQALGEIDFWPPFSLKTQKGKWLGWFALFTAMGAHSASLVAILQPVPFIKTFPLNDAIMCGIDPADLSLTFSIAAQSNLDRVAFGIGLQLGSYYDQVGGNTTTSVVGRTYVKDDFGYAVVGTEPGALQEVPGVMITAQCKSTSPNSTATAIPWLDGLPSAEFANGTGSFIDSSVSTTNQAVIMSATSFNLTDDQMAMYAFVNASGAGGLLTVDANRSMVRNFTALTLSSDNSSTAPAPVGRSVLSVVQGMVQAISLGALLSGDFTEWADNNVNYRTNTNPTTSTIVQTLIADGLKGSLTAYTAWADGVGLNQTLTGVGVCNSHNRTTNKHWHFGDDHYLGCVAIALELGFGFFALWVVCTSWNKTRLKGFDPLKVVDAFKMGEDRALDTADEFYNDVE